MAAAVAERPIDALFEKLATCVKSQHHKKTVKASDESEPSCPVYVNDLASTMAAAALTCACCRMPQFWLLSHRMRMP